MKQVVLYAGDRTFGLDPLDGTLLWSLPHRDSPLYNAALMPVAVSSQLLFTSARSDSSGDGSRLIQVVPSPKGRWEATEVWWEHELKVEPTNNALSRNGSIYATSGESRSASLYKLDAKTGQVLSTAPNVGSSNLLALGEAILLLNQRGVLRALVERERKFEQLWSFDFSSRRTWTAPIYSEGYLVVRDRKSLWVLDLLPTNSRAD